MAIDFQRAKKAFEEYSDEYNGQDGADCENNEGVYGAYFMSEELGMPELPYRIIRSRRKTMSLEVHRDGEVIVRAPQTISETRIQRFVVQKSDWILKNLQKASLQQAAGQTLPKISSEERMLYRKKAEIVFAERAAYFAAGMRVQFNRITIREQKTRWGSCSSGRNLNFNWKLLLAPPEVLDYVVVHELCHLKEMNHSQAFWSEVECVLPDYREHRKWLRNHGWILLER